MNPTDTLREAVRAAIRAAFEDETNGKPVGNIINIGCEGASYLKPDDAANEFLASATDAALSAIEAAGWRVVPVEPTEVMLSAAMDDLDWWLNPSDPKSATFNARMMGALADAYGAMLSATPRLDATVRSGEEG